MARQITLYVLIQILILVCTNVVAAEEYFAEYSLSQLVDLISIDVSERTLWQFDFSTNCTTDVSQQEDACLVLNRMFLTISIKDTSMHIWTELPHALITHYSSAIRLQNAQYNPINTDTMLRRQIFVDPSSIQNPLQAMIKITGVILKDIKPQLPDTTYENFNNNDFIKHLSFKVTAIQRNIYHNITTNDTILTDLNAHTMLYSSREFDTLSLDALKPQFINSFQVSSGSYHLFFDPISLMNSESMFGVPYEWTLDFWIDFKLPTNEDTKVKSCVLRYHSFLIKKNIIII